jgi:hypothetical protein
VVFSEVLAGWLVGLRDDFLVTIMAVADNQKVLLLAAGVERLVVVAWEWAVFQIAS